MSRRTMRRRHVHWVYAALVVGFGLAACIHGVRLHRATRTNQAVLQAGAGSPALPALDFGEVRFARALAAAHATKYEDAVTGYKSLVHGDREDLERAALYNLGNLHLREAMRLDPADTTRSLPLIELAKQSYRDLLRLDAADWSARYNLERALSMAPEPDEATEDLLPPLQSERAITTMKSDRGGLP